MSPLISKMLIISQRGWSESSLKPIASEFKVGDPFICYLSLYIYTYMLELPRSPTMGRVIIITLRGAHLYCAHPHYKWVKWIKSVIRPGKQDPVCCHACNLSDLSILPALLPWCQSCCPDVSLLPHRSLPAAVWRLVCCSQDWLVTPLMSYLVATIKIFVSLQCLTSLQIWLCWTDPVPLLWSDQVWFAPMSVTFAFI